MSPEGKEKAKRVFWRFIRAGFASLIGAASAKYGGDPIYGPAVTTGLLTLDKMLRDKATPQK
jgi:hypothetical protein